MTDTQILTIAGIIIGGLFTLLWYFVQKFIRKTEENDDDLINTLDKLDKTMNQINENLIVFRTNATDQFHVINDALHDIKGVTEKHTGAIKSLDSRIKVIETHHGHYHPNDKL